MPSHLVSLTFHPLASLCDFSSDALTLWNILLFSQVKMDYVLKTKLNQSLLEAFPASSRTGPYAFLYTFPTLSFDSYPSTKNT